MCHAKQVTKKGYEAASWVSKTRHAQGGKTDWSKIEAGGRAVWEVQLLHVHITQTPIDFLCVLPLPLLA